MRLAVAKSQAKFASCRICHSELFRLESGMISLVQIPAERFFGSGLISHGEESRGPYLPNLRMTASAGAYVSTVRPGTPAGSFLN